VEEHLAPGQTSTTGVKVGVPLSLGYDERGRVVYKLRYASGTTFESLSIWFQEEWVGTGRKTPTYATDEHDALRMK